MYDVFTKLLNMGITAGILALAVILIRLVLKRAPRKYICILWALVALRLLCPISISSPLSVFNLINSGGNPTGQVEYFQYNGKTEKPSLVFDVPALVNDDASPGSMMVGTRTSDLYLPTIMYIWLTGTAVMVVYALVSYFRIKRETAASIRNNRQYYICDEINTPFILGIIRPRIFIPSGLDETTRKNVLAHERAHLKRHDHWWKPLGYVLLSVHWFNPILWVSYVLFCRDIESACDEKVIEGMDKERITEYSVALLTCATQRRSITACPIPFGETDVKGRIKKVLKYKKPAFWVIIFAAMVCLVVAICFLTNPKKNTIISDFTPTASEESEAQASSIPVPGQDEMRPPEQPLLPYQAAETVPFAPSDIRGLEIAEIHEAYGDFSVNSPETLQWLESQLSNAEEITEPACPFGTVIYLFREDGTVGTIEPAEDSCSVFRSNGKYYQLKDSSVDIISTLGVQQNFNRVEVTQNGENHVFTIQSYWWYKPEGNPAVAIYDGNNRLIRYENDLTNVTYEYNDIGYCIGRKDFYFDEEGNLHDSPDRVFTYNYDTGERGLISTVRYDADNNSTTTFEFAESDAKASVLGKAVAYVESLPAELRDSIINIEDPFFAQVSPWVSQLNAGLMNVAEGYEQNCFSIIDLAFVVVFKTNSAEIPAPIAIYVDSQGEVIGMMRR